MIKTGDNPQLTKRVGHTIIPTDGTTLLGADDKAGVAEIMTAIAWIKADPAFSTARSRSASPPTRRWAAASSYFDVEAFGADFAYTMDGSVLGEIEDETFYAGSATFRSRGPTSTPATPRTRWSTPCGWPPISSRGCSSTGRPRPPRSARATCTPTSRGHQGGAQGADPGILVEKLTEREDT